VQGAPAEATTELPPPTKTFTSTPTPTQSQIPVPCYLATLVFDNTIPDGTMIQPGTSFFKTWLLRNEGSCTWDAGYQIVFVSGDPMSEQQFFPWEGGSVSYGDSVKVSVDLVAPYEPGTYQSNFMILAPDGTYFGVGTKNTAFWTKIVVPSIVTTVAPDWEGPYPPEAVYPANFSRIGCSGTKYITLKWTEAYDPSGISQYEVFVETSVYGDPGKIVDAQIWPTDQLSYDIVVACGYSYRWNVQAQDVAQNWGGYGADQYFDVVNDVPVPP
jgi:hypothetical protein